MQLFDDIKEPQRRETASPITNGRAEAERLWKEVGNHDPLPDTLNALKRIPDAVRAEVEIVSKSIYREEFLRLAEAQQALAEQGRDSLNMLTHSAKLTAFCAVSHLAAGPWHLADGSLLKRIAADLRGARSLTSATRHLDSVQCMSLFVAALESDDRESYLKGVKNLLKRHEVKNLVFDDELIEWLPESEFLAACQDVGLSPINIGIASRKAAARHSYMRPELTNPRTPAVFVDSTGRKLQLSAEGEVILPQTASVPDRAPEPAAAAPAVRQVPKATPAPAPLPEPTAPSSAMQSRIQALRQSQSRRAAKP